MNYQAFKDQLDTWGADISKWPTTLRLDAENLLISCPKALNAFRDAGALDAILNTAGEAHKNPKSKF